MDWAIALIGWVILVIILFGFGILGRQKLRQKVTRVDTAFNGKDTKATVILEAGLNTILCEAATVLNSSNYDIRAYDGFRLGEVTRHFDTGTSATIHGWMNHNLVIQGWGIGVGIGHTNLGVGNIGIQGMSQVSLTSSGTNRDDLMSDGFVAILERNNGHYVSTLRVIVPSETATRGWLAVWLSSWLQQIESSFAEAGSNVYVKLSEDAYKMSTDWKNTRCYSSFERSIPHLLAFKDEASYVSDRLYSILRMAPESRPVITVYGCQLSEHAILGTAIYFSDENRILPLFPIYLVRGIPQAIHQTLAVLRA